MAYTNVSTESNEKYLEKQIINITFSDENVANPVYLLRTTRRAKINIEVKEQCSSPYATGCTTIEATKILEPNIFYKVESNIEITYDEVADTTDTLVAIMVDDGKGSTAQSSATINKIYHDSTNVDYVNSSNSDIKTIKDALDYIYEKID